MLDSIVESPQNLYNICDGLAFVDEEDLSVGSRRACYIGFRHPVAFLYHAGAASRPDENSYMVRGSNETNKSIRNGEEWFEVFVSGKGFPYGLAHISSKISKQVKVDLRKVFGGREGDSLSQSMEHGSEQQSLVQYYLHKVDMNLAHGAQYTVFTPKIFYS